MRKILHFATPLLLALPHIARAEPAYPSDIQSHLGLGYTPPCTVCHATNSGGLGTISTPFGKALQAHGLTTNSATLDPALDALASTNNDSDGNSVPDIQQLKNGNDPNTGAPLSNVEPLQFGCGAHIAKQRTGLSGQGLVLVSLALFVLCRRIGRRVLCSKSECHPGVE